MKNILSQQLQLSLLLVMPKSLSPDGSVKANNVNSHIQHQHNVQNIPCNVSWLLIAISNPSDTTQNNFRFVDSMRDLPHAIRIFFHIASSSLLLPFSNLDPHLIGCWFATLTKMLQLVLHVNFFFFGWDAIFNKMLRFQQSFNFYFEIESNCFRKTALNRQIKVCQKTNRRNMCYSTVCCFISCSLAFSF